MSRISDVIPYVAGASYAGGIHGTGTQQTISGPHLIIALWCGRMAMRNAGAEAVEPLTQIVDLFSDKRKVSVEAQRKLDLEKDFDGAKTGAMLCALGLGGLGLFVGLIPAAWFLFLVMLGQIASALRSRD